MSLTVSHVRLPLLAPFTTSFGTETSRNALILRMTDGDDEEEKRSVPIVAYGECVASEGPFYGYEDNVTALHIMKDYLAAMVKDRPSPQEFIERSEKVKGHNMAKAAMEMMLWDYSAKRDGDPMYRALGPSKGYADAGISLGIDKEEATLKKVEAALERGYRRVKLKIERGKEYQIVKSVRDRFPEIELSADANSCYTLKDASALQRLDGFELVYLEQPLGHDDLLDHAKLARSLATPVCLDESISSVDKARQALELGACKVINIKPGRLGGFTNSLAVAQLAREAGAHVWVGGMLETGIGRAFNVAFASLMLVDYPGDTSPNDRYFSRDIVKNPFRMSEDGRLKPNEGEGIGVQVDDPFFDESTVSSWQLG